MIIGIGGVSRAGKSTLAANLKSYLEEHGHTVDVFCQDDFVKPKISIPKVEGVADYERPSTIKWDHLTRALEKSKAQVKIIEGLFSFYPASLRSEYDVKVFLDIDKQTFLERRKNDERWGDEPDWYAEHVWRSFLKYGQTKGDKDEYLVFSGSEDIDLTKILNSDD